jgi:3-hydroxyisobutyrate dehydrogenase
MTDTPDFKNLGFIGLGAMGKPMLSHLANKLPKESRIWVYDVVEHVVDEVCAAFPERVLKAGSAKEVAQHAVRSFYCHKLKCKITLLMGNVGKGYNPNNGA